MTRCLVLGGNGFIGKHLVTRLSAGNRSVSVADVSEDCKFPQDIRYHNIAKLNDDEIGSLLSEQEEIVDLAYATNPKTSFDNPVADITMNLVRSANLLSMVAKTRNLRKFLYVSSGGVIYGNNPSELIDEGQLTSPISPYGISKLAIEKYGMMYRHVMSVPFVAVRPSNAYGPGQQANRGQGFVAQMINNVKNGLPVEIFGEQGTVRDYIFIGDLVDGITSVLDAGKVGEVYNLGTGIGLSNIDMIDTLGRVIAGTGNKIVVEKKAARKYDVARNVLNCEKALAECRWKANVAIEDGLRLTWESA